MPATSARTPQPLAPVISLGSVCRLTPQLSRLSGPADIAKADWRLERDSLWMTL